MDELDSCASGGQGLRSWRRTPKLLEWAVRRQYVAGASITSLLKGAGIGRATLHRILTTDGFQRVRPRTDNMYRPRKHETKLIEAVRQCAAEKMTMSQAAARVGITRSAIGGLAGRNGIRFGNRTRRAVRHSGRRKARDELGRLDSPPKLEGVTLSGPKFERAAKTPTEYCRPQLSTAPIGTPCTLLELHTDGCHWPIGQFPAGELFCNAGPVVAGRSYCSHHFAASRRGDRRP